MEDNSKKETDDLFEAIRYLLVDKGYPVETVINALVAKGTDPNTAEAIVFAVAKQHKATILENIKTQTDADDKASIGLAVSFMIALFIGVFGVQDVTIILLAALVCAGVLFYCYPKQNIAAAFTGFLFVILFPFAYHLYFTGRTHFLRIELLIPAIMVGLPLFGLFKVLEYFLHRSDEA